MIAGMLAAGAFVGVFGVQARSNANDAVPLPDGVVVFGELELTLEQGTNILSGDTASNGQAIVQREGLLADSLIANRAVLGQNVHILSDLEADRITGPNFIVEGETISPRVTEDFAIPDLLPFQPGTENIRIRAGETTILQPGAFGRLSIEEGANVTLQGGTYNLRSIQVGEGVVFNLIEPITLNIQQHASFGSRTIFSPDLNLDLNDIRINYAGRGVVSFHRNSVGVGILHAPNAAVFLGKQSEWRGQLAGRRVVIGKEGTVSRENTFVKITDLRKIVTDDEDGSRFAVNEIVVNFTSDATRGDVDRIAQLVDGIVTGFVASANIYQIEVEASDIAALEALIEIIDALGDPQIEGVMKNYLLNVL